MQRDEKDCLVFVSSCISGGAVWMTVRQKKTGIGRHRVKSPRLSLRETEAQAQQDLDTYARVRGWRQA